MKKSFLLSGLLLLTVILPSFASIEDDATVLYNKGIDLYEHLKIVVLFAFRNLMAINLPFSLLEIQFVLKNATSEFQQC